MSISRIALYAGYGAVACTASYSNPLIALALATVILLTLGIVLLGRGLRSGARKHVESLKSVSEPPAGATSLHESFSPAGVNGGWGWIDQTVPQLIAIGLLARLATALVVNGTDLWWAFGPDALGYEEIGHAVLKYWLGETAYPARGTERAGLEFFWPIANAVACFFFGSSRIPLSILNGAVGVASALITARIAQELYGPRAARVTLVLLLFCPSLILWSSQNLRDVWAHMGLGILILSVILLRRRLSPGPILLATSAFLLLFMVRPYLGPLLLLALALSFASLDRRNWAPALVGLISTMFFIIAYGDAFGVAPSMFTSEIFVYLTNLRAGTSYGNSAYNTTIDTTTALGTLRYLPIGTLYFLFSPFPWSMKSWRAVLALPEAVLWFALCSVTTVHLFLNIRSNWARIAPVVWSCLILTAAYALVSGNEGTAFRHRAQVMTLFFVLSGAALTEFSDRFRSRQTLQVGTLNLQRSRIRV